LAGLRQRARNRDMKKKLGKKLPFITRTRGRRSGTSLASLQIRPGPDREEWEKGPQRAGEDAQWRGICRGLLKLRGRRQQDLTHHTKINEMPETGLWLL